MVVSVAMTSPLRPATPDVFTFIASGILPSRQEARQALANVRQAEVRIPGCRRCREVEPRGARQPRYPRSRSEADR